MDKEVVSTSVRASRDGGTTVALGSPASAPSVPCVRIPVRPQPRVWYALWNNKNSSRVKGLRPARRRLSRLGQTRALSLPLRSARRLAHRGVRANRRGRDSMWLLQRRDWSRKRNRCANDSKLGGARAISRGGRDYSRWNRTADIGVRQESSESTLVRSRPFRGASLAALGCRLQPGRGVWTRCS